MPMHHRRNILKRMGAAAMLSCGGTGSGLANRLTQHNWQFLAHDVRREMAWAWRNYVELTFGHDQLRPLSGGIEEFFFPNGPALALTIIEALDTLYVMGLDAEFEEGVRWITKNLHFDIDGEVQVFETNIRVVGGLLSAWCASHESRLLDLARDCADRLLPAFTKSPTGIPYRFVNLKTGRVRDEITFPAEFGTYIAEFGTLAGATKDRRYYDVAKQAARAAFDRRSSLDLIPDTISAETGKWVSSRATIGPPSDSYYEYLWAGWRLFGDEDFRRWYEILTSAILTHQLERVSGRLWFRQVDFETGVLIDRRKIAASIPRRRIPMSESVSGSRALARRNLPRRVHAWRRSGPASRSRARYFRSRAQSPLASF